MSHCMRGIRDFPRELVDLVIDQLATTHPCLLSCSLVNSAWRSRAQYHLFRELSIALVLPPGSGQNCRSLERLAQLGVSLSERPKLGDLVHTLVIHGPSSTDYDAESDSKADAVAFEARCNALLNILPFLRCVHRVTLENLMTIGSDWGDVPTAVQHAIFELFSQSSVAQLSILGIAGMPVLPLARFNHLEYLEIETLSLNSAEVDAPFPLNAKEVATTVSPARSARHLTTLILDDADTIPDFLRYLVLEDALSLSTVKKLQIPSYGWESPQARADLLHLFTQCRDSLEEYVVMQEKPQGNDHRYRGSLALYYPDQLTNC